MKILIDTTISKKAKISLFDGSKLLVEKNGDSALELVNKILVEKNLNVSDVAFELKNEPGSYTGLKVGASIVNTLNFVNGKKDLVIPNY